MQIPKTLPALVKASYLRGLLTRLDSTSFNKHFRLVETNPGDQFQKDYQNAHITKAIFLNTLECSSPTRMFPRDLPDRDCFKNYAGSLGISNKHHLILYDRSPFGFFASSRMWWIFRFFGHENVSILDGGLSLWAKSNFEVTNEVPTFEKETFEIRENKHLVRNFDDISRNLESKREQVVDVRASEEFHKTLADDKRPNQIPNSINLPYNEFFDKQTGTLKSAEELKQLFASKKIDFAKPTVASCMTGMTACTLAYAAYLTNNVKIPVYYGSWTEYSQKRK